MLNEQYDKNLYLDQMIEDLYLYCEGKIQSKMGTIGRIKDKITKLEELADVEEMMAGDEEGEPIEMFDDEGKPIKIKIAKKKMCKSLRDTGKCKNTAKTCKYAHNPIELELIGSSTKISNLQNVVRCLDKAMRNNKSVQDWIPPSDGGIEDCKYLNHWLTWIVSMFQPYVDYSKEAEKKEDDGDDEKPKRVFDRDNVRRKPFDDKE